MTKDARVENWKLSGSWLAQQAEYNLQLRYVNSYEDDKGTFEPTAGHRETPCVSACASVEILLGRVRSRCLGIAASSAPRNYAGSIMYEPIKM